MVEVSPLDKVNCFQFTPVFVPQLAMNLAAILDSGAMVSLIAAALLEDSSMEVLSTEPICVRGVASSLMSSTYVKLSGVKLLLQSSVVELPPFDAYVVEELPVDLILSREVMSHVDEEALLESLFPLADSDMDLDNRVMATDEFKVLEDDFPVLADDLELREDWFKLIRKFPSLFQDGVSTTPFTSQPYRIKLTCEVQDLPQFRRARSLIPGKRLEFVEQEIRRLLALGVIQPSDAPVASPIVLVRKGDSFRMCVDYTQLNDHTLSVASPLPSILAILHDITRFRYFTKLDLRNGYHQMVVDKDSQALTAFIAMDRQFTFTRVPFGLRNAPYYFQEAMLAILGDLVPAVARIYIDDIVIFADSMVDLLARCDLVFDRLARHNVHLRGSKCIVGTQSLEYLGHHIANGRYSPLPAYVDGIRHLPFPSSRKQLRSFVGKINYLHSHIPKLALLLKPFHVLMNGGRYEATEEHLLLFEQVKEAIRNCVPLAALHPTRALHLECDASEIGIGACLFQTQDDDTRYPVAFISHTFSGASKFWKTIEKECFAIYFAFCKWEAFLLGRLVNLYTDHKNLLFLLKNPSSKIVRWTLYLQQFTIRPHYIPGVDNGVADALSRAPSAPTFVNGVLSTSSAMDNELLVCVTVPSFTFEQLHPNEKKQLISTYHNAVVGHLRKEDVVAALIRNKLTWPGFRQDVGKFIKYCDTCQRAAPNPHPWTIARRNTSKLRPFERFFIDTMGPFSTDPDPVNNRYIIVAIDAFTRFCELRVAKSTSGIEAAEFIIQNLIPRYNLPLEIQTDCGTQFRNELNAALSAMFGVRRRFSVPYHPQSNGLVERLNKEIAKAIRILLMERPEFGTSWSTTVPFVQRLLNFSTHSATGQSPMRLMFGDAILQLSDSMLEENLSACSFDNSTPIPPSVDAGTAVAPSTNALMPGLPDIAILEEEKEKEDETSEENARLLSPQYTEYIANLTNVIEQLVVSARTTLLGVIDKRLNANSRPVHEFQLHDLVLRRHPNPPSKFHPVWIGPYRIVERNDQSYLLENVFGTQRVRTSLSQMKYYFCDSVDDMMVSALRSDPFFLRKHEILDHSGDPQVPSSMLFSVVFDGSNTIHRLSWMVMRFSPRIASYLRCQRHLHSLLALRYGAKTSDTSALPTTFVEDLVDSNTTIPGNESNLVANISNASSSNVSRPRAVPSLSRPPRLESRKPKTVHR